MASRKRDRRHPAVIARGVREAVRARAQEPLPPTPGDVEEEVEKAIRADRRRVLRALRRLLADEVTARINRTRQPRSMFGVADVLKAELASWERPHASR